jgi:hypothetical protein
MYERAFSLFNYVIGGNVFSLALLVIWGLLMAWLSYKIAGWAGFSPKWKKITAVAGFLSFGGALIVVFLRWAYKAFVKSDA